jgi:hypothetical protein
MSSIDKISLQILSGGSSSPATEITPTQHGETTIQIQTSENWVVTGTYRHNVLKAINLNKLGTPKKGA